MSPMVPEPCHRLEISFLPRDSSREPLAQLSMRLSAEALLALKTRLARSQAWQSVSDQHAFCLLARSSLAHAGLDSSLDALDSDGTFFAAETRQRMGDADHATAETHAKLFARNAEALLENHSGCSIEYRRHAITRWISSGGRCGPPPQTLRRERVWIVTGQEERDSVYFLADAEACAALESLFPPMPGFETETIAMMAMSDSAGADPETSMYCSSGKACRFRLACPDALACAQALRFAALIGAWADSDAGAYGSHNYTQLDAKIPRLRSLNHGLRRSARESEALQTACADSPKASRKPI